MKPVFLLTMLALLSTGLYAQKLDKAKDKLKEGKLEEAKTEVEAFLAIEKNAKNADAWYTKAKVYNAIAVADKSKAPEARAQAFDALKKYVQFDDKMLITLQIDKYEPVNSVYSAWFKEGADNFNEKKYEIALTAFKNAIDISNFMIEKKWLPTPIDTTSVLYAGVSSEKLNNNDQAAQYYSMLADKKIIKYGGDSLIGIYQWLARHYSEKKDAASTQKYITLGKELFPTDPYWSTLELEVAKADPDKKVLFAKYEDIISKNPADHAFQYDYAYELYKFAYDTSLGKRPPNANELIQKALDNVNGVIKIKSDFPQAHLFAGQIIFNQGVDLLAESKKIKGTKPEDVKKKADLKAEGLRNLTKPVHILFKWITFLDPKAN